jgi:hypothetical protein
VRIVESVAKFRFPFFALRASFFVKTSQDRSDFAKASGFVKTSTRHVDGTRLRASRFRVHKGFRFLVSGVSKGSGSFDFGLSPLMNWILILYKNLLDRIYRICRILFIYCCPLSVSCHRPIGPMARREETDKTQSPPAKRIYFTFLLN